MLEVGVEGYSFQAGAKMAGITVYEEVQTDCDEQEEAKAATPFLGTHEK